MIALSPANHNDYLRTNNNNNNNNNNNEKNKNKKNNNDEVKKKEKKKKEKEKKKRKNNNVPFPLRKLRPVCWRFHIQNECAYSKHNNINLKPPTKTDNRAYISVATSARSNIHTPSTLRAKDEINVPIALSAFRDKL